MREEDAHSTMASTGHASWQNCEREGEEAQSARVR